MSDEVDEVPQFMNDVDLNLLVVLDIHLSFNLANNWEGHHFSDNSHDVSSEFG